MILSEAISLLTSAPGSFIYHLTLAAGLALLLGIAHVFHVRGESPLYNRWRLAAGGLLGARLILMTAAGATWLLLVESNPFLPPIDRFVSVAGIVVLFWALLSTQDHRPNIMPLLIALGLGLLGMIVNLVVLYGNSIANPFNSTLADAAWSLAGLSVALSAAITMTLRRPPQWYLNLVGFCLLTAGFALHMTQGPKDSSLAGFVRWAELGAYPLLTLAATSALTFARPVSPVIAQEAALERSPALGPSRFEILAEIASLINAEKTSELATLIVKSLATSMRAELCLLFTAPDPSGQFAIATAYDLIHERHLPGATLDSKNCPVIITALTRHRSVRLPAVSRSPDMQTLQAKLSIASIGPSLLVPLIAEEEVLGGVMLLSPYTRRPWSVEDQIAMEQVASHIAQRLLRLNRTGMMATEQIIIRDKALLETQRQIFSLEQTITHLTAQLQINRDAEGLSQDENLSALRETQNEALETIQVLEAETEQLKAIVREGMLNMSPDEIKRKPDKYQMAIRELHEIRARLAAAEAGMDSAGRRTPGSLPDIEVITSIAKELRQSMSSIIEYTDLLLGETVGTLGTTQRNFIDNVRSSIEKMESLVDNLLQITAVETSKLSLIPEPVDLLHCIDDAVTQASVILRKKKLTLWMDFPDQIHPIVGEQGVIVQIIAHLLNNAIGASPGGEEIIIAVRIQEAEGAEFIMLTISDAGDGIPIEDLGRVFQPVDPAGYLPIPGLGDSSMSLSTVQELSEAIGGRIWFDSEVGIGSTFTILMPVNDSSSHEINNQTDG